ncbi:MAG: ribosome-binding factor A [Acidobacteria bacterium 13_1_40CM_4_61_5]|nr:MAG: ribosome-binding factor A [Acidobacteria bacterium 13_1_40CM_4_61_5]
MTNPNHRHERIGEEIQHELSAMVAGELKDPRLECGVTVTEVRVSPDLRQVRVYIGVNGNEKEQAGVIRALDHAAGFVRHEFVERLQLRRAPELHFVLDRSEQYTERIEQLLRDIKKSESAES